MSSATGELIFNAIKKTLDWYCLDLKKCVGFGCDGASVMVGQHLSVWSRIKEVNINPSCILMKCIRHSLVLCAGSAWFQEAVEQHGIPVLGRIQHLTKGGSNKRPPKAVAPRGSGGMLPRKIFNLRASEMRFPVFQGAIWSGLIALKYIY